MSLTTEDKTRIVHLARQILAREIDPVEAAVRAVGGRPADDDCDDPDLMVLHMVEDQADEIPWGEQRKYWNKDVLSRIDADTQVWLAHIWPKIERACRNLIQRFEHDVCEK